MMAKRGLGIRTFGAGAWIVSWALMASAPAMANTVVAWGSNSSGQTNVPAGLTNIAMMAAGSAHNLALRANGTVAAWGYNGNGQCNVPANLSNVVAVAAGDSFSLALRADGSIAGWGNNGWGQCNMPAGPTNFVAVAGGLSHSVALRSDGTVVAWGHAYGQIPAGLSNVVAVTAGESFSIALCADGTVVQWGTSWGEIPTGLSNVVAIAAKYRSSLALCADGTLVAWGNNENGQCDIPGDLTGAKAIAAGGLFNMALQPEGTIAAWGTTNQGQGDVPADLTNAVAIAAGFYHAAAISAPGELPPPGAMDAKNCTCGSFQASWITRSGAPNATNYILDVARDAGFTDYVDGYQNRSVGDIRSHDVIGLLGGEVYFYRVRAQAGGWISTNSNVIMVQTRPKLVGWGYNNYGQATTQVAVINASMIAAGGGFSLAVRPDGKVATWGYNGYSQCAVPTNLLNPSALAAGNEHGLAIRSDGTVVAWGNNNSGQCNVPALTGVQQIAAGYAHCLARQSGGVVTAWGHNSYGQSTVPSGLYAKYIAAGGYHSLAARTDGTVAAWGQNNYGQTNVPADLSGVSKVAAGYYHCLALKTDGTVVAWGRNNYGQTNVPAGLTGVVAIASGYYHNLALCADGTVVAWGYNNSGQTNVPAGLSNVVAIAAGSSHSMALCADGSVILWGGNTAGQSALPQATTDAVEIACGDQFTLALHANGTVSAWGYNSSGQCNVPGGVTDAVAVAAGYYHSVALKSDGTVAAWGQNGNGQCNVPAELSNVVGIAAGAYHSLAVKADGRVAAWGYEYSRACEVPADLADVVAIAAGREHSLALKLDGTVVAWGENAYGATDVPLGLSNVVAIAGGEYDSMALRADGTVVTWGGYYSYNMPAGLSNVVAIAAGYYHKLALRSDGTVAVWGQNSYNATNMPVGLSNVVAIAAGRYHSVVLLGSPGDGAAPMLFGCEDRTQTARSPAGIPLMTMLRTRDDMDPAPRLTYDPPLGTLMPIGTSTVSVVARDAADNATPCQFTLTVVPDTEPPQILDCADREALVWSPTGGVVRHEIPLSDNADIYPEAICNPPMDSFLPIGDSVIDVTARDASGNENYCQFTVAVKYRSVAAWGNNEYGQCDVPADLTNALSMAGGSEHAMAVRADGTVVVWGHNEEGLLNVPAGVSNVLAVAAGNYHCLALRRDGTVVAWGDNGSGQCNVPGLANVVAIAGGGNHSLALRADGTVAAWGDNSYGQRVVPLGLADVVAIAAGSDHNLALRANGTVVAWGSDNNGQCGAAVDLTNVVAIAAGQNHSLALCQDGTVVAWGDNSNHQCDVPESLSGVVAIAAGDNFSVALKSDGTIVVWGERNSGQGDVPWNLDHVITIVAGGNQCFALVQPPADCAGDTTGPVIEGCSNRVVLAYSWVGEVPGVFMVRAFDDTDPQPVISYSPPLGSGLPLGDTSVTVTARDLFGNESQCQYEVTVAQARIAPWGALDPELDIAPSSTTNAIAVAVGIEHLVALRADGRVVAWGNNRYGQCNIPAEATNMVAVAAGSEFSLALGADGTVQAWGRNNYGQCNVPTSVREVVAIDAGMDHCLALRSDGTVTGWGNGGYAKSQPPLDLTDVIAVAAGYYHSLALKSDGTVVAWGQNNNSQCDVPGDLADAVAIAAGGEFSVVLKSDGTVVAWGNNGEGQCNVPVDLDNVVSIVAGEAYVLAFRADGTVAGWGRNWGNQCTLPVDFTGTVALAAGGNTSVALFLADAEDMVAPELFGCQEQVLLATPGTEETTARYMVRVRDDLDPCPVVTYDPPLGTALPVGLTPVSVTAMDRSNNQVQCQFQARVIHSPAMVWGANENGEQIIPSALTDAVGISAGLGYTLAVRADGTVVAWGSPDNNRCNLPEDLQDVVAVSAGNNYALALKADGTVVAWGDGVNWSGDMPSGLADVVAVAVGGNHSLVLRADGTLTAWGDNGNSQCKVPSDLNDAIAIAAGETHSLALRADGTVVAWGDNGNGQCEVPPDLGGVRTISAGGYHNLALKSDGTVVAWGDNSNGQCEVPMELANVVAISAHANYSLALLADGTVVAWGANDYNQCTVPGSLTNATAIAAGESHAVALVVPEGNDTVPPEIFGGVDRVLRAYSRSGTPARYLVRVRDNVDPAPAVTYDPPLGALLPLGDTEVTVTVADAAGNTNQVQFKVTVVFQPLLVWGGDNQYGETAIPPYLTGITAVAAGEQHSMALAADGAVTAWGYNESGQCNVPAGLHDAAAIAAGSSHSLALRSNGTVAAWGNSDQGQCNVPSGLEGVKAIDAGSYHSLALRTDGTVVAWGNNNEGQSDVPANLTDVIAIAAGGEHNLALKNDGSIVAWGRNWEGECNIPEELTEVVAVAAGMYHSVALQADGTVVAWGPNWNGECNVPEDLTNVVAIAVGEYNNLALKADGTLVAWGPNSSGESDIPEDLDDVVAMAAGTGFSLAEREDGTVTGWGDKSSGKCTVLTSALGQVAQIAAGQYYNLVLRNDGTVTAWGNNEQDQCKIPAGLSGVVDVAAGVQHSLALKADGTVVAWGDNNNGKCDVPAALQDVVAVAAGSEFSLALRADGTVAAWGDNNYCDYASHLQGIVAISAGYNQALALKSDGTVIGWGNNNTEGEWTGIMGMAAGENHYLLLRSDGTVVAVGDNSYGQCDVPPDLTEVVKIAASQYQSYAIRADGTVVAWGNNEQGYPLHLPAGLSNVADLSAGAGQVLALLRSDEDDTTPPQLSGCEDRVLLAFAPDGAAGTYLVRGWDDQDPAPSVTYDPPMGAVLPLGTNTVTVTARDAAGNESECQFNVVVALSPIVAWGENGYGQGNIPAAALSAVAVAAGPCHSLALLADGTVVAWGYNNSGQRNVPAGLSDVVAISAGYYHSLALRADGTVVAWGDQNLCRVPTGLSDVIAIAAGDEYSLALRADGTVVAWGQNNYGECDVPEGLADVVAISAGVYHSLALRADGTVVAWGDSSNYGLCNIPEGLTDVVAIAAGAYFSLALKADGTVAAWGPNWNGECNLPEGLADVVAIFAGDYHSVALKADGTAVSWGPNWNGECNVPADLANVLSVAAGQSFSIALVWRGETSETDVLAPEIHGCAEHVVGTWNRAGKMLTPMVRVLDDRDPGPQVVYDPPLGSLLAMGDNPVQVTAWDAAGNTNICQFNAKVVLTPVLAWGENGDGQCNVPAGLTDVVAVAAGSSHNLVLHSNGTVTAWGYNENGECNVPAGLTDVIAIEAGSGHSLALRSDGTVVAWGNNGEGQCTVPTGLTNVIAISAGSEHNLALRADGTVVAWGRNWENECDVPGDLTDVVAVSAGGWHSLALKSDGTVVVWGANWWNQCDVPGDLSDVVAISAGDSFNLALKSDGTVVAWGSNWNGEGNVPEDLTDAIAVVAGGSQVSMALRANGTVVAWGYDGGGLFSVPENLTGVLAIAAGSSHCLALLGEGGADDTTPPEITGCGAVRVVYVENTEAGAEVEYGEWITVTDNEDPNPTVEFDPPSGSTFFEGDTEVTVTAWDASGNTNVCAFTVRGAGSQMVVAWGSNNEGQSDVPENLVDVVAIAGGSEYSLALKSDGTVAAWGYAIEGGPCDMPEDLTEVVAIAAGYAHGLALKADGTVVAWGFNDSGQCNVPAGLIDVVAISAGSVHSLALQADGTVVAWGDNSVGQCNLPTNLADVVAISAGYYHNLARLADGSVVAWGQDVEGQCDVPAGLLHVVAIAAGGFHSLALQADGTMTAWGYNEYGQCNVPEDLTDVMAIGAGDRHSLALRTDGMVVAWGANEAGQCDVPGDLTGVTAIAVGEEHSLALLGYSSEEDETPPAITGCGETYPAAVPDENGGPVEYGTWITVVDDTDPAPVVEFDPPSGSTFALGDTVVTVRAWDAAGNTNECTFTVHAEIADTAAPTISGCTDLETRTANPFGTAVAFAVAVVDDRDPAPVVVYDPPSGSQFPIGDTRVTVRAWDAAGNTNLCEFTVSVTQYLPGPRYVSLTGLNVYPYTNWATAARSIQNAVDATMNGDEVWVADGTYYVTEEIDVAVPMQIRSVNGPEWAILRRLEGDTGIIRLAGAGITLDGFTLEAGCVTNGSTSRAAGASADQGAVIQNCIIRDNVKATAGGAGGLVLDNGARAINCLVYNNSGADGEGTAGGVQVERGSSLINCTVVNNTKTGGTGIGGIWQTGTGAVYVDNSIAWGNQYAAGADSANVAATGGGALYLRHTCYADAAGQQTPLNSFSSDPLLVDAAASNLHLAAASPCLNAGNNAYNPLAADIEGNPRVIQTIDLGAYERLLVALPAIKGRVLNQSTGAGVDGVRLSFSDGAGETVTAGGGWYEREVPQEWSGRVTPLHEVGSFDPGYRDYSNVTATLSGQHYTWTPPLRMVSGRVTHHVTGDGLDGVTMYFSGGVGSVQTAGGGYYTQAVYYGWSGYVSASYASGSFTPSSRWLGSVTEDTGGQDYQWLEPAHTISGRVTDPETGTGVDGVWVSSSAGGNWTSGGGYYAFQVYAGWSGTVSLWSSRGTFAPASRSYAEVTGDVPDQDYAWIRPWVISGRVTNEVTGAGVDGVAVRLYDQGWKNVVTHDGGSYSLEAAQGWTGEVTLQYDNGSFAPASRSYVSLAGDQADQDFQWIPPRTISGRVVQEGTSDGLDGVTVSWTDNGTKTTVTSGGGYFSLSVRQGWSGTVAPSSSTGSFAPASLAFSEVQEDQTDADFEWIAPVPVSGRVVNRNTQAGVGGVYVQFSNGGGWTYTGVEGTYTQTVARGWSGRVSLWYGGGAFTPAYRDYTGVAEAQTDQDYEWTPPWLVRGRVTDRQTGLGKDGVTVYFSGGAGTAQTSGGGYYSKPVAEGWSGWITPVYATGSFTPSSRSLEGVEADQADQDFEWIAPPPTVVRYVSPAGSATPPYTSWETAAHDLPSAIAAAAAGDVLRVTDGVYQASATIEVEKAIRVESVNGAGLTILQGGSGQAVLRLAHANAVVSGFTIRNGQVAAGAGGVDLASGYLNNCIILGNEVLGVAMGDAPTARMANCLVTGNGAGVEGNGVVVNCTVVGNTETDLVANLVYNTIVDGDIEATETLYCLAGVPIPGNGNIVGDPGFYDAENGDYRLLSLSPARDAGNNYYNTMPTDLAGQPRVFNIIDMGAYERPPAQGLAVSLSAQPDRLPAGALLTYKVEVHNAGPASALEVGVSNFLPAEVTFLDSDAGNAYAAETGVWTVGNLPAGASTTLTMRVQTTVAAMITNQVIVWAASASAGEPGYEQAAVATEVYPKADQTIDFPALDDQYTTNVVVLMATAASGLPVEFAVVGGPASLAGGILTFTGPGTVSIVARQAGDADWNSAPEVIREFTVWKTKPDALFSTTDVRVREDGAGRFFLRLQSRPADNILFTISRVSGSDAIEVRNGAARSFKPSNWDVWQAVVLAAGADANADNETATFRMSAPGYEDTLVTATVLDDDIGENLALPASGSMLAGMRAYQLAQVVDGVHTTSVNYGYTIWTNDPPGTMTLDLQRATTLSRVRLLNWDWTYRVNRYRLEASADGTVWTDLAEDAHETDRQGWDDWTVTGEPVRYVRFTGLSGSANQCVVLSELEVYGTPEPLPVLAVSKTAVNVREAGEGRFFVRLPAAPLANVTVTVARSGGDTNLTVTGGAVRVFKPSNWDVWQAVVLAAGADANAADETAMFQVSAPGYADTVVPATALDGELGENLARAAGTTVKGWRAMQVANAVDGVHTSSASYTYTIWTNDPPGMLTVDLKSLKNLTRVRLLTWDWTYRVNRYRLEASADGVNWTDLAPTAQTTDRQGWDNWPVTGEPVRYVRFTGLYSSANQCAALSELEIFGGAPARRSVPAQGIMTETSEPVSVLTSAGPEDETGWAAVDGDPETAWTGQKAGGGYLVVEYAPALTLRALEVDLAEGSLSNVEYLYSQDAEGWLPLPADLETNPVSLNFLWLVFPSNGTEALPEVKEIRLNY